MKHAIDESKAETPESRIQVTKYIQDLNKTLVDMNIELTGTRSIMHYLSESANVLVNKISPFEDYVNARFKDWEDKHEKHPLRALRTLKKNFRDLDGFREKIRDNDKLMMVWKCMLQNKVDIKSLQLHIDINIGMVSFPELITLSVIVSLTHLFSR